MEKTDSPIVTFSVPVSTPVDFHTHWMPQYSPLVSVTPSQGLLPCYLPYWRTQDHLPQLLVVHSHSQLDQPWVMLISWAGFIVNVHGAFASVTLDSLRLCHIPKATKDLMSLTHLTHPVHPCMADSGSFHCLVNSDQEKPHNL